MSKTTVLVGFAEAMAAPETVWSLVDGGYKVIAFARNGRPSPLRHSHHVTCYGICPPEKDIHAALSDLQKLLNLLEAQAGEENLVLFPLDDKAVWMCSNARIEGRWLVAGPVGPSADLALFKNLQVKAAREAGFNVPNTKLARTSADLIRFTEEQPYPVILKAAECVPIREGRAVSCGKWICANRAELQGAIDQWQERVPLLAQNFIAGVGEGVFGLAAAQGVRALSGHYRIRMMNPEGSGSSACASKPVAHDVAAITQDFITRSGWRGLFMIELLRDNEGRIWFVELNGRPWGSMALCRRQGLEYPAWHVDLALDDHSSAGADSSFGQGIVCRNAGREFMHLLFVLRGARSNALSRWPSFWKSLKDVLYFGPADGLYNWRRDDSKVFFADFYCTVHDHLFKSKNESRWNFWRHATCLPIGRM